MINKKIEDFTLEEKLEVVDYAKQLGYKPKKRRMKDSKKLLRALLIWTLFMQSYVMVMIVRLHDTQSLAIITGVVFLQATAAYLGYLKYNYGINIKAMEQNFDPNYDENNGVY